MQRNRLETFRQSYVAIIVVVRTYSPVTGNRARRLHGNTPRDNLGPRNPVVAHSNLSSRCSRHRGRQKSPVWGDATPSIGGDAPSDKGPPAAPGKGSAGDTASGKGAASVSESLQVVSWLWSTNPALADRPTRHWRSRVYRNVTQRCEGSTFSPASILNGVFILSASCGVLFLMYVAAMNSSAHTDDEKPLSASIHQTMAHRALPTRSDTPICYGELVSANSWIRPVSNAGTPPR